MSDVILAVVLGFGAGGWVFFRFNHRTGDANASPNFVAGIFVALAVFFFVFTFLRYVLHIK